jgi:hypothetical protein
MWDISRLKKEIPELKNIILHMRNRHLTRGQIAEYFIWLGYHITEYSIKGLLKKYNIKTGKRSYIGELNPYYGKKHTQETKNKLSVIHIGKHSGIKNPMYGKKGNMSPAWKGGISNRYNLFYGSLEWQIKRIEIMSKDGFVCKECGKLANKTNNTFNVHHIIPLSIDWNLRLDDTNLITLCMDCHKKTFNHETEHIQKFYDIVRTTWRHVEIGRNDQSPVIQE